MGRERRAPEASSPRLVTSSPHEFHPSGAVTLSVRKRTKPKNRAPTGYEYEWPETLPGIRRKDRAYRCGRTAETPRPPLSYSLPAVRSATAAPGGWREESVQGDAEALHFGEALECSAGKEREGSIAYPFLYIGPCRRLEVSELEVAESSTCNQQKNRGAHPRCAHARPPTAPALRSDAGSSFPDAQQSRRSRHRRKFGVSAPRERRLWRQKQLSVSRYPDVRRSASSRRTLGRELGRYGSVLTAPPPAVASLASSPPCCQPLRRAGRFSPFLSAPLCRAASHALPTPRVPAPGAPGREWAARRRGRLRQVTELRGSAAQSPHHLPRPAGCSAVVRGRGRGRGQAGPPRRPRGLPEPPRWRAAIAAAGEVSAPARR
ncbi:hypothetical protein J1605_015172 [Eschrichtius robustus]|uniref:Uncharacterized protein n=1 Tax=Eschrichtius robustus TaxID=9764 RepID=A0AB34G9S7_ESCRO|nr:hypothetical protein J1605_015172 [Eschrichtius robustus]